MDAPQTPVAEIPQPTLSWYRRMIRGWFFEWLLLRPAFYLFTGLAAVLAFDLVWEHYRFFLLRNRWVVPGGWLVDGAFEPRWDSIWHTASLCGLLLPNIRFSRRTTCVVLSGLIGMPVGLLLMHVVIQMQAVRAFTQAQAPFPDVDFNKIDRRLWSIVSLNNLGFEMLFTRGWLEGLLIGLLLGFGWTTNTGRRRTFILIISSVVTLGFFCEAWSTMTPHFKHEVQNIHRSIQLQLKYHEPILKQHHE